MAQEAGALGCAIAAAVATGEYPSLDEAIRNMTEIREAVMPNGDLAAVYDRKYHLYLRTIECLDGLWDEMQEMVE